VLLSFNMRFLNEDLKLNPSPHSATNMLCDVGPCPQATLDLITISTNEEFVKTSLRTILNVLFE
jgi:hypothetical protein